MVDDYRAGLGPDRQHDADDRAAGRTIQCPTLVLWSEKDDMGDLYGDPSTAWRPWVAGELESRSLPSGHHVAEEAPDELASVLVAEIH